MVGIDPDDRLAGLVFVNPPGLGNAVVVELRGLSIKLT